jgi:hypothetical protein
MMATKNIAKRRKIRALETKRDQLMERQVKDRQSLAEVRAALKAVKREN